MDLSDKLYDLDHSGEPVLYFFAEPYNYSSFPESHSGLYAIQDNQLVELLTGYECGGSSGGNYVCLWYDRETAQVFPGTWGHSGGFGGHAYAELFYDWNDKPYTKETLAQAKEEGGSAQAFFVNDVQTTIEEYLKMEDRYQRLTFME